MLNAVLFDLDNTLIDRNAAFEECVRASFAEVSVRRNIIAIDAGGFGKRETLFSAWEDHAGTTMTQGVLGKLISGRIRPDPTLLHALKQLSRTVKIGLITNGSSETQRRKLRASGLDLVFGKHIWISEEVGRAKPNPEIFELALRTLNERPRFSLYLGDHDEIDLRGAHAAGMRASLVKRVLTGQRFARILQKEFAG